MPGIKAEPAEVQDVFQQGEAGDAFYILIEGEASPPFSASQS